MLAYNDATNLMPSSTTFTVEPFVVNQMLIDFETQETDASWSSWEVQVSKKLIILTNQGSIHLIMLGNIQSRLVMQVLENGDVNGSKFF